MRNAAPAPPKAPASAAPMPAAPRPMPQPAAPQPMAPRPMPQPAAPQPMAPRPVGPAPVAPAPIAQPMAQPMGQPTGQPVMGAKRRGGGGAGKWIAIVVAVLLVTAGAVAIVMLDPFGGDARPKDLSPPKVVVSSEPAGLEIFDHGRFRGETPIEYQLGAGKTDHRLQIAAATGTFKVTMAAQQGPGWLYLVLPKSGKVIGHALVVSTPTGANVKVDGKDAGKTPLTIVGAPGQTFALEVAAEGGASKTAQVAPAAAGARVEVALE